MDLRVPLDELLELLAVNGDRNLGCHNVVRDRAMATATATALPRTDGGGGVELHSEQLHLLLPELCHSEGHDGVLERGEGGGGIDEG